MEWLTVNAWLIVLLVELVILAGMTWLIHINKFHYNQSLKAKEEQVKVKDAQIKLNEERIAILEQTQVDNFMAKYEAQQKLFKEKEDAYIREINKIVASQEQKDKLITELKALIKGIEQTAKGTLAEIGYYSALGGPRGLLNFGQSALNPHYGKGMADAISEKKKKNKLGQHPE